MSAVASPWEDVEPLAVPAVAETAEAVIEDLDARSAAAAAVHDGLTQAAEEPSGLDLLDEGMPLVGRVRPSQDVRPFIEGGDAGRRRSVSIDDYARSVLYNGLGHYQAARAAAQRACACEDFMLLDGALAELVEASVRSGNHDGAVSALRRLQARAEASGSAWALGVAACSRALLSDDDGAEADFLEAIERLRRTNARVALGRAHLLYGEWLRRQARRVDAREQLSPAHHILSDVGLGGFAERARRELLATGETVRKRSDDTRRDLTPQEAQIAELAAGGWTNPEIGQQLFISPRTVEWHLRKVYTKLGVCSRRELNAVFDVSAAAAG